MSSDLLPLPCLCPKLHGIIAVVWIQGDTAIMSESNGRRGFSTKRAALTIMVITIASKVVGFARDLALSYFYGAGSTSDAYLISIAIPGSIFSFIAAGLAAGYVPMYTRISQEQGNKSADRFTNNLVNVLLAVCTVIVLIVLAFAGPIVRVFASGFEGETLDLAVKLTKMTILSVYFAGLVSVFSGYLQIKGNFAIPASVGFPMNFFVILSIVLSSRMGNAEILGIGYIISMASQFILFIPFLRGQGYKHTGAFDLKDEHVVSLARIVLPLIIGSSINQINVFVDRTMASRLAVGGISALNYADKVNSFPLGLFALPIATALYPAISQMAAEKDMPRFKKSLSEAVTSINLFMLPSMIGAMVFATPIVSLLFGRGAFDRSAMHMTSSALFFYSMGMVGYGLRLLLTKAFHSLQDTITPMINGAIGAGLNIVLNIALSRYMGISGLALATALSALFTTGLLFVSLRKKIGPFGMKQALIAFFKTLLASAIMGAAGYICYDWLMSSIEANSAIVISLGVACIAYAISIYFLKIPDVETMLKAVKQRFGL